MKTINSPKSFNIRYMLQPLYYCARYSEISIYILNCRYYDQPNPLLN